MKVDIGLELQICGSAHGAADHIHAQIAICPVVAFAGKLVIAGHEEDAGRRCQIYDGQTKYIEDRFWSQPHSVEFL